MHRYLPELAERPVPRYTSYPTAAEFDDRVGASEQAAAIDAVTPATPVSLYVHIPYCHQICWYCGCNTGALGRGDRLQPYVEALAQEIALVGPRMLGEVTSVHFGGGSPNALPPAMFAALAARLRDGFDIAPDASWAVEIDPRHFTRDHAETYAACGVDRLSIGAQTFAPRVQAAIGRIQPLATVSRAVADARAAGIGHINLDLMYGLPGQSNDDIAATIAAARQLRPDRIAMFGYAHMPSLLPRQKLIEPGLLPGARARFWQSALAHDLLVEAGYAAIGFDHFARPEDSLALAARAGRLHRNFQGFTDDSATTLVGLGASAISEFAGLLVQNEKHVGRYKVRVGNAMLAGVRGVARTAVDRVHAGIIERLLCDGSVDLAEIALLHRCSPIGLCSDPSALVELEELGVVDLRHGRITITPLGRPYARLVAAAFDTYRPAASRRFSSAV